MKTKNPSSHPILVLGALGNVGAEVVKAVQARGAAIRAGDLSPEKVHRRFGPGTQAVAFDFHQPETFEPAFQGVTHAFIMRPPQISNIRKFILPALEVAKSAGVRHLVFLSLIGIEQNRRVPHYQMEQWMLHSGLDYTFLRCSFFMQNLNTTHRTEIRERDEIYVPVGSARTSFLDVRDIGAVAALALTQPGHENKAYDLTGGEALDYFQVADMFSAVLGRKITYKNPSPVAFFFRQLQNRSNLTYAAVTTWLYNNTKNGMAERVTPEVERLLGRKPLQMKQYIQDYQENWSKP